MLNERKILIGDFSERWLIGTVICKAVKFCLAFWHFSRFTSKKFCNQVWSLTARWSILWSASAREARRIWSPWTWACNSERSKYYTVSFFSENKRSPTELHHSSIKLLHRRFSLCQSCAHLTMLTVRFEPNKRYTVAPSWVYHKL